MEISRKLFAIVLKKMLALASVITVFIIIMSYPGFSYKGEASIHVIYEDRLGWMLVNAECNMTYSPFLYAYSWLTGKGQYSEEFFFWSKPTYYFSGYDPITGEPSERVLHRTPEDLQSEAIERKALKEMYANLVFNLLLSALIIIAKMQDMYISIILGTLGFSFLGFAEALVIFVSLTGFFVYVRARLKTGILISAWNYVVEEYRRRKEPREPPILKKLDVKRLPFIYRIILKIPVPSLDALPSTFQGIFWAIIVPVLLVLIFLFTMFSLTYFIFPLNVILSALAPIIVFLLFLRIIVERFIKQWNAMIEGQKLEWNVAKQIEEYLELLKKQKEKKS
jgi:hypothetical protein